jgi:hypothetical protein
MVRQLHQWAGARVRSWGPEEGDAVLYAFSALFAGITAKFSQIDLYRTWGELALGPYLLAAAIALVLERHRVRLAAASSQRDDASGSPGLSHHLGAARIWLFLFVLVGATLAPLSLEVAWRSEGNPAAHVQPEVVTIEQAGHRAALGQDPYHAEVKHGHIVSAVRGEPTYESFFPYLPLMSVFGLPSSTREPVRVTDARIFFSVATLLVVALALGLCDGPTERKVRALQVLTVLPTAALPLATGGDDMPIVAFLLLGMVLAQRRQPVWSGIVLGIVSAMKFTAWPLAALALFAARDKNGKRAPLKMAIGMLVVIGPVVVPFLFRNADAFVQNVILFPLGLAGVASPAASPLPGHLIVAAFPQLHRILPLTVGVLGGLILARHLLLHPPQTTAQATSLAGWVMLIAILFAPATRVGYLLYPVNFFVWAYLLRDADELIAGHGADQRSGGVSDPPGRDALVA